MYSIGDYVWWARLESVTEQVACQDCCGKKYIRVIFGDNTELSIDCANCSSGYEPPRGTINRSVYTGTVQIQKITGIEVGLDDGKEVVTYRLDGWVVKEQNVWQTRLAAEGRAEELRAEHQKQEDARRLTKEKDTRTWAWNASYHRSAIRQAQRDLEYHTAKLEVAKQHAKENA